MLPEENDKDGRMKLVHSFYGEVSHPIAEKDYMKDASPSWYRGKGMVEDSVDAAWSIIRVQRFRKKVECQHAKYGTRDCEQDE